MTQDIATTGPAGVVTAVNPATGEIVDLKNDATDLIAAERRRVTELKDALTGYAAELDEELTLRLDKANTRSAEVGGWRIETKAPTTLAFDVEKLRLHLYDLIAENLLDEGVAQRVFIPQPDKLNRREAEKLLRHADKRVREHVAAAGYEADQRRTVSVRPA